MFYTWLIAVIWLCLEGNDIWAISITAGIGLLYFLSDLHTILKEFEDELENRVEDYEEIITRILLDPEILRYLENQK